MMSDEDSEESFSERIKEDLARFKKEYAPKDWTCARIMIHFVVFLRMFFGAFRDFGYLYNLLQEVVT